MVTSDIPPNKEKEEYFKLEGNKIFAHSQRNIITVASNQTMKLWDTKDMVEKADISLRKMPSILVSATHQNLFAIYNS